MSKGGGLDDEQGNEGKTSKVRLHAPEPGDGDVEGLLTITDNGDRVRATGTVREFDPDKQHITLFQGRGSEARGPRACEPVSIPLNLSDPEDVSRNGSPDYVPLHEVGTVSIRGLSSSGPLDRAGFGPEAVVACGDVAV